VTELPSLDATYVAARRVLMDALLALAIYLRTGSADLTITVAPLRPMGTWRSTRAALAMIPSWRPR
jgi:hypothetical protein